MKKIFLILIVLISVLITGCSNSSLKELTLNELKEKLNNKETFIVYFDNNEQNSLKEKIESITDEYNLKTFIVNTNKISDEERIDFQTTINYEIPSIVFIINGIDSSKLSHVTSTDITKKEIIARLKDMNFIKEVTE